jgi:hypothetical protein
VQYVVLAVGSTLVATEKKKNHQKSPKKNPHLKIEFQWDLSVFFPYLTYFGENFDLVACLENPTCQRASQTSRLPEDREQIDQRSPGIQEVVPSIAKLMGKMMIHHHFMWIKMWIHVVNRFFPGKHM